MRSAFWIVLALSLVGVLMPAHGEAGSLKVLTINVWSGLDYIGTVKMGEYESAEIRKERFRSLVTQVKKLSPDVIFVQEANPVVQYAADLASALAMDEVHQVVNGGIKVGSVGIPTNLKEGLVILARPELSLRKSAVWKLSGSLGIHTDLFSFHLNEVVLVLAGKIVARGKDIYLVNVHLAAAPRKPGNMADFKRLALSQGVLDGDGLDKAMLSWDKRERRRMKEVKKLLKRLKLLPPEIPCIVGGDFNAEPGSREMRVFTEQSGLFDALADSGNGEAPGTRSPTWNVDLNLNTSFSADIKDARCKTRKGYDYLSAMAGSRNRRLDYIFLGKDFSTVDVLRVQVVLKDKVDGLQPSDHFGVLAEIDLD